MKKVIKESVSLKIERNFMVLKHSFYYTNSAVRTNILIEK